MARAKTKATDGDLLSQVDPQPTAEPAKPKGKPSTAVATVERLPPKVERLPVAKPENLLVSLFSAITDSKVEPAKVVALTDVRDKLMREQAYVEFMTAYIEMQAELPRITKDGLLDQGTTRSSGRQGVKARWATYEHINDSVRPILVKHKFGMLLLPDIPTEGGGIIIRGQLGYVCTTQYGKIVHAVQCTIPVPNDPTGGKSPPQGVGAALSYGKRYGAIALLNLVSYAPEDADDDAVKGSARAAKAKETVAERISAKQAEELRKAIEFCGVGEARFCEKFEIQKVEDLLTVSLADAMGACRSYAEKAGKNG